MFEFECLSSWTVSREDTVNLQCEASAIRDAQAHAARWATSSSQEVRRYWKCSKPALGLFCPLSVLNFFTIIILLNLRLIHPSIHSFIHSYMHSSINSSIHSLVVWALFWRVPLYVGAMHLMDALAFWAMGCYLAEVVLRAFPV